MHKYILKAFPFLLLFFAGISYTYLDGNDDKNLKIEYPLEGTVFPPEFASPTIKWSDDNKAKNWNISFKLKNGKTREFTSKKSELKPYRKIWEEIKAASINSEIELIIENNLGAKDKIKFKISPDSVNAPIFYRDVPLPFNYALRHLEEVRWRLGDVSSDSMAIVLMENLPVCANCHSFSKDGSTMAMDVDAHSGKDAYGIASIEKNTILYKMIRWSFFQDGEPTYGLLSNLSPNGRYVASTLKDNEFFVIQPDLEYSQLFFPIKGILVIYDQQKDKFFALPGADDTSLVQSNPNWTPDGKHLLFARTKAIQSDISGFNTAFARDSVKYQKLVNEFYEKKRKFKYDIYKIPFNNGKGGVPEPIKGASHNGMSNFFPRMSPNGKWIVFTQSRNYMLLQPDSKLYIIPAEGGKPRLMNCNTDNMNSWHSWSPNGKWLVFSSKIGGPYTQLYITHIDENGNDTPPVLLENMWLEGRAANIPEFVNVRPGELVNIEPKFLENDYFSFQKGVKLIEERDLTEAVKELDKAAKQDPDNFMVYGARGFAKAEMGDYEGALADYNKALLLKPNDFKLYNLRGFIRIEFEDYKGAIEDFTKSIEFNRADFEPYNGRGYVKILLGKYKEAIIDFNIAIALKPDYFNAYYERGLACYHLKEYKQAVLDLTMAIRFNNTFGEAYYRRGQARKALGEKIGACKDFETAEKFGVYHAVEERNNYCK